MYLYIHQHYILLQRVATMRLDARPAEKKALGDSRGGMSPQLRFIHTHQLFRTQYTCFYLDAVDIYWWICMNLRRVISTGFHFEAPESGCTSRFIKGGCSGNRV